VRLGRRPLAALGALSVVAAGTGGVGASPFARTPAPVLAPVASAARPASQVQVIAHPDDDLYFMTPDVDRFIGQGNSSTTVVLTAGEHNGTTTLTREQYAGQRQDGLRAAYAHMADVDNVWQRATVTVSGKQVERDTLVARPQVALVFLNLPDGKDSLPGRSKALENLWRGAYGSVVTLVPTGSTITKQQAYTPDDLTRVLTGLYTAADMSIARLLDSHPDHRFQADHTDHIHSARFAEKALSAYTSSTTGTSVMWLSYRGPGIAGLPPNLDADTSGDKRRVLATYAVHDPAAGLADVGSARADRMYTRYLGPGLRTVHQADGRLAFAAVVSGSVHVWTLHGGWTSHGGQWSRPVSIDGPRLAPPLAAIRDSSGHLRLFALSLANYHLLTAEQIAPNVDAYAGWADLGNPDPTSPHEIGSPEAIVDRDGRGYVFVKNHGGGVSARIVSPTGTWSAWQDLGGVNVIESLYAALDPAGRVELYAATVGGILRWTQQYDGGPLTLGMPVAGTPMVRSGTAGLLTAVADGLSACSAPMGIGRAPRSTRFGRPMAAGMGPPDCAARPGPGHLPSIMNYGS
jgi:LmbE family N-acetylglucosaminyl deacetylase